MSKALFNRHLTSYLWRKYDRESCRPGLLWTCLIQGLTRFLMVGAGEQPQPPPPLSLWFNQEAKGPEPRELQIVQRLESLGARVFNDGERVVEVKLDRTRVTDEDLKLVAALTDVTDLSLEMTQIGDTGMGHLKSMHRLEWLNLFGTQVGDKGLEHLKQLTSLKHLPVGHTKVTDAGMVHLESMPQLRYLGLR